MIRSLALGDTKQVFGQALNQSSSRSITTIKRLVCIYLILKASMEIDQQPRLFFDFDLRFPPLSRTVAEISDLLNTNGMPDTDRLINIVHMDPLVVASVLKRINSAFYGMRQHFQDIRKAILMIGFIEVCNIVLASGYIGLKKTFNSRTQTEMIDRIMRVSVGSGYFTNLISQHLRLPDKASAFTAGLLHNIGRFVLLFNLPEAYEQLFRENNDHYIPSSTNEISALGIDHSAIGALAAQYWNFPELVSTLIESYQDPGQIAQQDHRTIALVLSASSSIATQLCTAIDERKYAQQAAGDTEEMEFPPIEFAFPSAFMQLAGGNQEELEALDQLVSSHIDEALSYIEMMMTV